jgi:hypothetical protein
MARGFLQLTLGLGQASVDELISGFAAPLPFDLEASGTSDRIIHEARFLSAALLRDAKRKGILALSARVVDLDDDRAHLDPDAMQELVAVLQVWDDRSLIRIDGAVILLVQHERWISSVTVIRKGGGWKSFDIDFLGSSREN